MDRAVGDGTPGDEKGAACNGTARDGASGNGNGLESNGARAVSDVAPGDGKGAGSDGAPANVPASSMLGWGIALSATVVRVPSDESRGGEVSTRSEVDGSAPSQFSTHLQWHQRSWLKKLRFLLFCVSN